MDKVQKQRNIRPVTIHKIRNYLLSESSCFLIKIISGKNN